jgi:flagellar biosynthesis/type III secretory pathway protein FliH
MAIVKKQNNQLLKPASQGSSAAGAGFMLANPRSLAGSSDSSDTVFNENDLADGTAGDRRKALADDRRQYFRRNEDQFLLSRAELEAESIKDEARQKGIEEGLNQSAEMMTQLNEAIESLLFAREQALSNASGEIADIAMDVVKHILKAEVSCDPHLVDAFVRRSIKQSGHHHKNVVAKVSPEDYPHLSQSFEQKPPVGSEVAFELMEDKTVDAGSCIIETEAGQIDRRFTTQLEVLKRLIQIRQGHDASPLNEGVG